MIFILALLFHWRHIVCVPHPIRVSNFRFRPRFGRQQTHTKNKKTARESCANYGHEPNRPNRTVKEKNVISIFFFAWCMDEGNCVCACDTVVFFVSWVLGR